MKTRTFALALLITATAMAGGLPQPGTAAPAFALTSDEGKTVRLEDLAGRWVVLYFYPKDFTSGCTLQAQAFQRDLAKYEAKGAVVVGVSVDSPDSHRSFCEKEKLAFRLLSDSEAKVSEAYGSLMEYNGAKLSARNTFLIDPKGRVARVFEKVKPAGHSAEVLEALDELQR